MKYIIAHVHCTDDIITHIITHIYTHIHTHTHRAHIFIAHVRVA